VSASGLFLSRLVPVALLLPLAAPAAAQAPAAAADQLPTGEPRLEEFAPLGPPGSPAETLAWPTVESTTDGEAAAPAGDVRYTVSVKGLEPLGLQDEFEALSSLWEHRKEEANLAQINRRIAEDRDLIDQLLRSLGHYGGSAQVVVTPPADKGATSVAFVVDPGPLYHFSEITLNRPEGATGGDPAAIVLPLLGLKPGDPVVAANVTAAADAVALKLADAGYAFPTVGKPDIVIDHASRTATLTASIDVGARGVFGSVRITGQTQGFRDKDVAVLARFKPGDPYSEAKRDDLRRALIQTGLFGTVGVKPQPGEMRPDGTQVVDLVATTEVAPVHTIAASGGYSTDQGIRVEASWSHRNLIRPQGAFTVRAVAAERQQVLGVELERRNWRRRDQTLSGRFGFSAEQQDAYSATTLGGGAAIRRESNILWQKSLTYSAGVELLVTRQRDRSAPDDPNNTYYILAFPGSVTWDRSDSLLNPTRGFRLTGRVSPEFTLRGQTYFNYAKAQIEGTAYLPLGTSLSAAGRLHFGAIGGASRGRIAPDRRFYAGGGGSVRGYSYQQVGPKDADGNPTGGNSLTEAAIELRYRFRAFGNDLGLVGFVDAGQIYQSSLPAFDSLKLGAGIGLRYFTAFGPVRIDIATPVTPEKGDPRLQFYVSIGQAF